MSNYNHKIKTRTVWLYLSPSIAVFMFAIVLPLFLSLYYSFFRWTGGLNKTFLGFENYIELMGDRDFWHSFGNNLFIIIASVIGQIGIPLLFTGLFTSRYLKFKEFHRTVIFVPVVLSAIVVGFLWSIIYNKDMGLLNWLLRYMGMEHLIMGWLDNPKIVLTSVTIPLIWQYIGLYLVIFMAALQSIDQSVLEVSEIDGAIGFSKLWYVILPQIKGAIGVSIMLCISGNMKVFDHIYVMTGGGPGTTTMVMAQYAYKNTFGMFRLGYGSAISVGILILSLFLIVISQRLLGGKND